MMGGIFWDMDESETRSSARLRDISKPVTEVLR